MTGRDIIIFILQNKMEDKEIFVDGKLPGLMTQEEAAVRFGVGANTILVWYSLNKIDGIRIGDALYIYENAKDPYDD